MAIDRDTRAFRGRRRRKGRRARGRERHSEQLEETSHYPLAAFCGVYLLGIGTLVLSAILAFPILLIVYPAVGFVVTRFVTGRIQWLPVHASVENIASAKLNTFLTWPITLPRFFYQLAIIRIL